jgi:hypothetical protein
MQDFNSNFKEVLKQQKFIRFAGNGLMFWKHSANNSKLCVSTVFINLNKFKTTLKKCPNIKCLQMRDIFINKSLIELISQNCEQLVCLHLDCPKSESKTPQIHFKEITKLLSDKIKVEINFGHDLS